MADEVPLQASSKAFETLQYRRSNQRRQEHLASLGLSLHNRSVLELGAAVGDHTTFFLDRGCRVTSVEPRRELCEGYVEAFALAGYFNLPRGPALINAPIESVDGVLTERFDVVYCYGLLYHLADPAGALALMAKWSRDLLLIETLVSYGDDDEAYPTPEPGGMTQAFTGMGCRPTRRWVFQRLRALFPYVYLPTTQPAHEDFPLDWTIPPSAPTFTRAVFVASYNPQTTPVLVPRIPDRQVRAP
jgi:hypothetical protein